MDKSTGKTVSLQVIAGMVVLVIGILLQTTLVTSMELLILTLFFVLSSLAIYFAGKRGGLKGSYVYALSGIIVCVGVYLLGTVALNFVNPSRS